MSDDPVPGYYMTRLTKGGPHVPLRIHFGPPVIDGEEQDRAPIWVVTVDGATDFVETGDDGYRCRVAHDVYRYWPHCGRFPISEGDYRFMMARKQWAEKHDPTDPIANPRKKIDVRGRSVF